MIQLFQFLHFRSIWTAHLEEGHKEEEEIDCVDGDADDTCVTYDEEEDVSQINWSCIH